jgi:hypothetical protein
MATHIKRDGNFLCLISKPNGSISKWLIKKYSKLNFVSFSDAVKMKDTSKLCGECQKKFYEKLNNMKNPIQVK